MIFVAVKNAKGEGIVLPYKNYDYFCHLAGDFLGMPPEGRDLKSIEAAGQGKFEFYAVFETADRARAELRENRLPADLAPKLAQAVDATTRRMAAQAFKP